MSSLCPQNGTVASRGFREGRVRRVLFDLVQTRTCLAVGRNVKIMYQVAFYQACRPLLAFEENCKTCRTLIPDSLCPQKWVVTVLRLQGESAHILITVGCPQNEAAALKGFNTKEAFSQWGYSIVWQKKKKIKAAGAPCLLRTALPLWRLEALGLEVKFRYTYTALLQ